MLNDFRLGQTSVVLRIKIRDSSDPAGGGLTGLTSASSGLIISTIADNESSPTTYTAAGSTIETIATLGTFAAPTATKCRFKEVSSGSHPGNYELQFADARYAVASAKSLLISIFGATNAVQCDFVIPLRGVDPYDAVRFGLTALPDVASGSAGAVLTSGTGTAQVSTTSGQVIFQSGTGTGQLDVTAGVAKSNIVQINGSTNISSDGTATAGGSNTLTLDSGVTFGTNTLSDRVITIDTGTGAGQSEIILSNTNATPSIVTITRNWPVTAPDNTSTYTITESNAAVVRPANVSGNLPADLQTIKTQSLTCAAPVTVLASVGTAVTATAQTGDAFARIGAAGAGLTAVGDARLANLDASVASRSTYAGGAVASVTGNVGGNVTGSVASVVGAVGSVTGLTASDVGAIKTKTDFLPSATPGSAGGLFIAGTNAATTVTTAFTSTFTGNLTGSVSSVTSPVTLNQTTIVATPRDLSSVADGALTIGDALVCAIAEAAGRETIVGLVYTKKSPFTATPIRVFNLDSATTPTSRT